MRARWLKPEFFRDKKIADMGPVTALVYQALWCLADDSGVAPCEPERIKGEMFVWWSAVGVPEITGALRHLSGKKILTIFRAGDDVFCRLKNFTKHQAIHKPSKFRYPVTGEPFTWDSAAPVPDMAGSGEALPTTYTPRYPSSPSRTLFLEAMPVELRLGWEATLATWVEGMGTPSGKAFTVEQIDAGLAEYLATTPSPSFSAQHVVRFVEKIATRTPAQVRAPRDEAGSFTALLNKEVA